MSSDKIKLDPKNYRVHNDRNKRVIRKSLEDCGAGRSVLIDKDNILIAGNGVYEQAKELGIPIRIIETDGKELVVVKRNDLKSDDEKRKLLALADNHASDTSMFDFDLVLQDFSIDQLDLWEFSTDDITFDEVKNEIPDEDNYDISKTCTTSIVLGDFIEIGNHKLICGDSMVIENYQKLLSNKKVNMVLIDPPYNVNYEGGTQNSLKILNDNMDNDSFYQLLLNSFKNMFEYTINGGAWYIWHADSQGENFRKAMRESGLLLKQTLIWVKNSMVLGRQDYQWQHEPCLYGWKPGDAHKWYSDRKQTTILNYDKPLRSENHPTMKPVKLFSNLIVNSSKKGDIVFDGFLGSGTTMVSCEELGRICYGFELDPIYCQVIIDRMKALKPNIVIKINNCIV